MKSTSGWVRILALSCTPYALFALYLPSFVLGQTTSAESYKNRGNVKYDKGDLKGAIADYNRTIELNPRYALAYNNRGNAKYHKGDRGEPWPTTIAPSNSIRNLPLPTVETRCNKDALNALKVQSLLRTLGNDRLIT